MLAGPRCEVANGALAQSCITPAHTDHQAVTAEDTLCDWTSSSLSNDAACLLVKRSGDQPAKALGLTSWPAAAT